MSDVPVYQMTLFCISI